VASGGPCGCGIDGWKEISDVFCPGLGIWDGTGGSGWDGDDGVDCCEYGRGLIILVQNEITLKCDSRVGGPLMRRGP